MTGNPRPALAIVAGGGVLPQRLAERCAERGDPYRLFAVRGAAGPWAEAYSPQWFGLEEIREFLGALAASSCREACFAGRVPRPSLASLGGAAALSGALAPLAAGMLKGDDALLRTVAGLVERHGMRVVGVEERMPELLAPDGVIAGREPDSEAMADIRRAAEIVRALGALDVGQAAVVAEGRCLAVETVEGTGAMLSRLAHTDSDRRGGAAAGRGVLVKAPKPDQDLRFDRPAVGPDTLAAARAAGLAGVAVEAGGVLVLERGEIDGREASPGEPFLFGYARSTT